MGSRRLFYKYTAFVCTILFILGCARAEAGEPIAFLDEAPEIVQISLPPAQIIQRPRFTVIPQNALPGEPVTIAYSDNFGARGFQSLQAVLMSESSRRLARAAFFTLPTEAGEPEIRTAILAIPNTASPGFSFIRIESADGLIRDIPIVIMERTYDSETIRLNQENTDIRIAPNPQRTAESEHLWAVLSRTGTNIYHDGPFSPPVESTRRTSRYAHRRVYHYIDNTTDTSIHAGIDYGVPTGTPVFASAAGRVVMAMYRIVTGNTVVLEHYPGVYTLYYHMDSLEVMEGDVCETGDLVGLSGSTGLSTGPHLHWEVRVSGEFADPDFFLARPILDKNEIITKLME